ncbi:MAG: NADH-quinone oxidoreductase subunit NuoE [Clostridia bacterium]|nr:NADH-quinone oxidoreductase subunit NuoE [Clostridia bacterium]
MATIDLTVVDDIIREHQSNKQNIIAILQDVQKVFRYLPEEALNHISVKLDMTPAKIYSIATFYENFSLKPKGKYIIRICDGTACHVKHSIPILNALKKKLELDDGKHTSSDMLFTLETVSCLGACGLAPVMMVNDTVHSKVTPEYAEQLIDKIRAEEA